MLVLFYLEVQECSLSAYHIHRGEEGSILERSPSFYYNTNVIKGDMSLLKMIMTSSIQSMEEFEVFVPTGFCFEHFSLSYKDIVKNFDN